MTQSVRANQIPAWFCWLFAVVAVVVVGLLRLSPATTRVVPIAFSVPLIISVWCDDKRIIWSMAACFMMINMVRTFYVSPEPGVGGLKFVMAAIQIFDVVAIAATVHLLVDTRRHVGVKTKSLNQANLDLAKRQELLARQNQLLSELNTQFAKRETVLHTLLIATRWDAFHGPGNEVISNICAAAIRLLGGDVVASAVLQQENSSLRIMGQAGLDGDGINQMSWPLEHSHAGTVMKEGRTSFVEDVEARPDLIIPSDGKQPGLRSLIATPLRIGGQITGVIEAYSRSVRQWTGEDFKIVEWLAAQASLAMEIIDLQRELEQRRRDAVDESVRKTRFLVAISHDVRTPANAINLMAELLLQASQDPARAAEIPELVKELRQAALAMTELISDVLDVSSFDSGRVQLEVTDFSLHEMLEQEVSRLRALATAKHLEMKIAFAGDDVVLHTDRTKFLRVLTNLISNAIKFTASGTITVTKQILPNGGVRVSVIDTGVGIPEQSLGHIFDEFFQLTNPARDPSKGTGMGLAICKRLVSAIGCELDVQSAPAKGATFIVTIPPELVLRPQTPAQVQKKNIFSPGKPLTGVPILLVEDHFPTRRATARLLSGYGATVLQAETGNAALEMLRLESPEILLLDLMLPDIDGSEILKYLRQSPKQSLRKIFAVSGDVTPERIEQVKRLGAEDLIAKPVDIGNLVRRITAPAAA